MTVKVYFERLFHWTCESCNKWWSVGDSNPISGQSVWCPHCGTQHTTPDTMELSDKSTVPIQGVDFVTGRASRIADSAHLFDYQVEIEPDDDELPLLEYLQAESKPLPQKDEAKLRQIMLDKSQPGIPSF